MGEASVILDEFCGSDETGDRAMWPRRIVFGFNTVAPPRGCFQVPFPRLELVLAGTYRNTVCTAAGATDQRVLSAGDALFIPADCWNLPAWDSDVQVLSLLFGAKHLGVSLVVWSAEKAEFSSVDKRSCLVPGNSPLYRMVDAVSSFQSEGETVTSYGRLQANALLEYTKILLQNPSQGEERQSSALYRAVCTYVEENFDQMITRDIVARKFQVSPNYLSRVFSDHGDTTFSDFLTSVRIGRAKAMLEQVDLPLVQVSQRCGFHDPNYFFKVFKKRVKRTPTEYRNSVLGTGQVSTR